MATPNNRKSRYPGIRSFEADERDLFFGREREIKELYSLVKVKPFAVLFAKSGIGKTSLLNAGIIPKLKEEAYHPIKVRFQDTQQTPEEIICTAVDNFGESVWLDKKGKKKLEEKVQGRKPLLWERLKAYDFENEIGITPVLVFDQFEEFFLHTKSEQQPFIDFLADALFQRIPDTLLEEQSQSINLDLDSEELNFSIFDEEEDDWYEPLPWKIVIAIRSDKLSLLDQFSNDIPAILDNRYQLFPLKKEQARQAIIAPAVLDFQAFESPAFTYQEESIKIIEDKLSNQKGEIESFQLQIICQHLEQKIIQNTLENTNKTPTVIPSYLDGNDSVDNILNHYYERKIQEIKGDKEQEEAVRLIEEGLIIDGTRVGLYEEFIINNYNVEVSLLNQLINTRLIRVEIFNDKKIYEVAHDTLVPPIVAAFEEKQIKREQEAAERERQRLEQEAAEERKKRRKANLITTGAVSLAVLAVVMGVWAWIASSQANKALEDLEAEQVKVIKAKEEAEQALLDLKNEQREKQKIKDEAAQRSYDDACKNVEELIAQGKLDSAMVKLESTIAAANENGIETTKADQLSSDVQSRQSATDIFDSNLQSAQDLKSDEKYLDAVVLIREIQGLSVDAIRAGRLRQEDNELQVLINLQFKEEYDRVLSFVENEADCSLIKAQLSKARQYAVWVRGGDLQREVELINSNEYDCN